MPEGVPIRVMTSQSIVLSGEGAKVSEITPRKSDKPFFIFSVAPEEPSVCREKPAEEESGPGAGCNLGYGAWRGKSILCVCAGEGETGQVGPLTPSLGPEERGVARVPSHKWGAEQGCRWPLQVRAELLDWLLHQNSKASQADQKLTGEEP